MWCGILIAVVAAVVLALILGIPTLRLRADYLAIVTIAAGEMMRLFFNSGYAAAADERLVGLGALQRRIHRDRTRSPGNKTYGLGPFGYSGDALWVMVVGWVIGGPAAASCCSC